MEVSIQNSQITGEITPPASKSFAQRALAASLLCHGTSTLRNMEMCDDTEAAFECIKSLGATAHQIGHCELEITGGINPRSNTLNIGESGLSTRLFTPIASLCSETITITGHGSILKRPMTMMFPTLEALGVEIKHTNGYLPLEVRGAIRGGEAEVDGGVSSQFLTGLLLALPCAKEDTTLHVRELVSRPYIDMTIEVAERFGVTIEHNDYQEFFIAGEQEYQPTDLTIEGDCSGASTLLVDGALAGSGTCHNPHRNTLQADSAITNALTLAGANVVSTEDCVTVGQRELHGFEFDATHCPDLFPALVALAANCNGTTTIKGTNRLTHKESNRALTLQAEFGKMGIEIDLSQEDMMIIEGGKMQGAEVESHADHRIAMALAVAALTAEGVTTIHGAECVAKSYPMFFEDFLSLLQ